MQGNDELEQISKILYLLGSPRNKSLYNRASLPIPLTKLMDRDFKPRINEVFKDLSDEV